MTEEEAKTKWCPMVHFRYLGSIMEHNKGTAYEERVMELDEKKDRLSRCIASGCMMWRIAYKQEKREGHSGGKQMLFSRGVDTGRELIQEGHDLWMLPESGYCGLGGKP